MNVSTHTCRSVYGGSRWRAVETFPRRRVADNGGCSLGKDCGGGDADIVSTRYRECCEVAASTDGKHFCMVRRCLLRVRSNLIPCLYNICGGWTSGPDTNTNL